MNRDYKENYLIRLEWGYIIALSAAILIFQFSKRFKQTEETDYIQAVSSLAFYDIPQSGVLSKKSMPIKPVIPIPVEEEFVLEDFIIESENDVNLFDSEFEFSGKDAGYGHEMTGQPTPRPIFEVIPEFPVHLRKKGIRGKVLLNLLVNETGTVDSVCVFENTTINEACADAAITSARQLRFTIEINRPSVWVNYTIQFE